jgi:hypothetical protein
LDEELEGFEWELRLVLEKLGGQELVFLFRRCQSEGSWLVQGDSFE